MRNIKGHEKISSNYESPLVTHESPTVPKATKPQPGSGLLRHTMWPPPSAAAAATRRNATASPGQSRTR